ncbi:MAG: peptide chain release factor N(5)-glutamine methyltransferase [Robiginitalea sp.]
MEEFLLRNIRNRFTAELQQWYPPEEIMNIFHLLTEHYFGFRKTLIALEPHKVLDQSEAELLLSALEKLKRNLPVQYITGKAYFMDMELQVSPSVLIPRPETEELVHWILGAYPEKPALTIIDIGTGSGCIALGLKKHWGEATIFAMDLSERAVVVAQRNARELQLDVRMIQGDIRDPGENWPACDVIVSNPPYVPSSDRASMQAHVAASEPEQALFVPDEDPLCLYRDILSFGSDHLEPGGWVYLEIYEAFGRQVCDLLGEAGYMNIELKKDIFGKDRFVRGQVPQMTSRRESSD